MTEQPHIWLVIEDEDDWYHDIHDAAVAHGLATDQNIFRAKSVDDYAARQRERTYNIITIDLRLIDPKTKRKNPVVDVSGGLTISPLVRLWNPEQLVVLFSAYVEVDQAVLAMRNGAWDCIKKTRPDSVPALIETIKEGLLARQYKNPWFVENLDRLVPKYGGRHIAVANSEVVADDSSLVAVRAKAMRQDPMKDVKFFLVPSIMPDLGSRR